MADSVPWLDGSTMVQRKCEVQDACPCRFAADSCCSVVLGKHVEAPRNAEKKIRLSTRRLILR